MHLGRTHGVGACARQNGSELASSPKSNRSYWIPKLKKNVERDARALLALREAGYCVFIAWECETRNRILLARRLVEIETTVGGKQGSHTASRPLRKLT